MPDDGRQPPRRNLTAVGGEPWLGAPARSSPHRESWCSAYSALPQLPLLPILDRLGRDDDQRKPGGRAGRHRREARGRHAAERQQPQRPNVHTFQPSARSPSRLARGAQDGIVAAVELRLDLTLRAPHMVSREVLATRHCGTGIAEAGPVVPSRSMSDRPDEPRQHLRLSKRQRRVELLTQTDADDHPRTLRLSELEDRRIVDAVADEQAHMQTSFSNSPYSTRPGAGACCSLTHR